MQPLNENTESISTDSEDFEEIDDKSLPRESNSLEIVDIIKEFKPNNENNISEESCNEDDQKEISLKISSSKVYKAFQIIKQVIISLEIPPLIKFAI